MVYDGTPEPSPGCNYVIIPHVQGDFGGELKNPRAADTPLLNGGVIDQYAAIVPGGDEPLINGVEHTFTFLAFHKTQEAILAALSNARNAVITTNTWVVGAGTFTNAGGTGTQIRNSAGVLTDVPQSADPTHMRVNFAYLQIQTQGGANFGEKMEECWVSGIARTIGATSTQMRVTFRRYGNILPITAFPVGTDLTPSVT
jgi:hypothetical protein